MLLQLDRPQKGEIAEHPLHRLLVAAALQRASGTLRLTRGKLTKVVYLRAGTPVYVDSNLRNETLGAHLVACGAIDETQLTRAMRHARANKLKLGQALIQLEMVDASTVTGGLAAQTQIKIVSALRWKDGSFSFEPGDDFSGRVPDCPAEPVSLVLAGLRHLLAGDERSLETALDRPLVLTDAGKHYRETITAVFGADLIRASDSNLALGEALAQPGTDVAAACVQVAALRAAGLAELGDAVAPSPASPPEARTSPTEASSPPAIPPALSFDDRRFPRDTYDGLLPVAATETAEPSAGPTDSNETLTNQWVAVAPEEQPAPPAPALQLEHLDPRSSSTAVPPLPDVGLPELIDPEVIDLARPPCDAAPADSAPPPPPAASAAPPGASAARSTEADSGRQADA